MKKLYIIALAVAMFSMYSFADAQDGDSGNRVPFKQFGAGVWVGGNNSTGVTAAYALNENVHLGSGLALAYNTGLDDGMYFILNPFLRYYLTNVGNFFPFVNGNLAFASTYGVDNSFFNVDVGGTWFPYNTLSVSGGIRFVNLSIDSGDAVVGLGQTFLCLEFWF